MPLPLKVSPQLATLVTAPPRSGEWEWELKFDGYRLLARAEPDDVRLFTRNGADWTTRLRHLHSEIARLNLAGSWLDGEMVVSSATGRSDFQALQRAFRGRATTEAIQYYVFDLLFHDGKDLRKQPLRARRERLAELLAGRTGLVRFSESFGNDPIKLSDAVASLGGEGLIGKRQDSKYVSGRSATWVKFKTSQREDFLVVGFTTPKGRGTGISALILGVYNAAGELTFAGKVSNGFDVAMRRQLVELFALTERKNSALKVVPAQLSGAHWLDPHVVADVVFTEWTRTRLLRHPQLRGLRPMGT